MRCSPCGTSSGASARLAASSSGSISSAKRATTASSRHSGARGKRCHCRARFDPFADALERLVVAIFHQCVERRRERRIVEQVASEDREQPRLGHERREREEHEVALRTLAAPAIGGTGPKDAEVPVAAGEDVVVARRAREALGNGELGQRPQQRAVVQVARDMRFQQRVKAFLECPALAPLVIDRLAVVFERRARGRAFVRECDRVEAVEHRRDREYRRVDCGDRNMAVVRALPVVFEQRRRDFAADVQGRQAGARGARGDQWRVANPDGGRGLVRGFQQLDADQRILAAADGNERAPRQLRFVIPAKAGIQPFAGSGSWVPAFAGTTIVRKYNASAQIELVVIRELAEAMEIQRVEKIRDLPIECARLDRDRRRHAGLVVADAGDEMQDVERRLERGAMFVANGRRVGKHDALDQLGAVVERIHQRRDTVGIRASHEAEASGLARIGEAHGSTTSAAGSRRL